MEVIGVKEGLSAGLVYQVAQDKTGYLWMATTQGLNRYDGNRIKVFTNVPADKWSLPDDHVKTVFIDSRGWIWLGTANKGLCLFDPVTERFHSIDLPVYSCIKEDAWGNIWVNDPGGRWNIVTIKEGSWDLSKLDDIREIMTIADAAKVFRGLPDQGVIPQLMLSRNHGVWWQKENSLVRYDLDYPKRTAKLRWTKPVTPWHQNEDLRYAPLIEDTKRNVVYLFNEKYYYTLDPGSGKTIKTTTIPVSIASYGLMPRLMDSQGRIYAHGLFAEVFRIDPTTDHFVCLKKSGVEAFFREWRFLCAHSFEGKDGNIWLPTTGYGVYQLKGQSERFRYFGFNHTGPSIAPLFVLTGQKILISDNAGNMLFDLSNNTLTSLWNEQVYGIPLKEALAHYVHPGPDGQFWQRFGDGKREWLYLCDTMGKPGQRYAWPLASDRFNHGIIFYSANQTMWVNVAIADPKRIRDYPHLVLYAWDPVTDQKEEYIYNQHPDNFLFGEVRDWLETPDRRIWMGMDEGGLVVFDPKSKQWTHFLHNNQDPHSISSNRILSLAVDPTEPDRFVWVGTRNGLNKLDLQTNKFIHFTTNQGLPNNVVYGILSDDHHNLWLSTNKGLCLFNPRTSETRNFTREDGLQHDEFNKGAYVKMPDGRMVFGGVGGLTWFNPDDFYQPSTTAKMVINGLRIINKEVSFSREKKNSTISVKLDKPVEYVEQLTLSHTDRMVTFEFAYMNLTTPGGNRFRYQLIGFDKDWVEAGTQNEATYTNLSPGDYTFKVQGAYSQGDWNPESASIRLKVLPPWWATWWFRLLVLALITYLTVAVIRYRFREKEKRQVLRNQISRDLHDEIGSTLSSVAIFSTVAKKKIIENDQLAMQLLDRIGESATQVMESMNDIVWAINSDNDRMEQVVQRMRAYISEYQDIHHCQFELQYEPELMQLEMSMVHRRNAYMVFKEAVNNAMKYARAEHIRIHIQSLGAVITLRIEDDGLGIDSGQAAKKLTLGGNGLENMRKRAKEVGGKLEIQSEIGKGTTVIYTWNTGMKPKLNFLKPK
jgi:two-component sensor histidine kinase/streptogramin lyase